MSPCAKMYKTLFLQQCKTYRPKKRQTTNYAPIMVCLQNYTPWAILSNIMCVCGDFISISFFVAVLHLCLQSIYAFSPTYKILGHGVKDVLHHGQDGNLSSISYYFFITLFYSVACVSCIFLFLLVVLLQLISLPLCVFAIVLLSFFISFWLISVSCCFVMQYTFSDKPIKHFILIHDIWSWVTT